MNPFFSLVQSVFRANGDDSAQLATGYVIIYPIYINYIYLPTTFKKVYLLTFITEHPKSWPSEFPVSPSNPPNKLEDI